MPIHHHFSDDRPKSRGFRGGEAFVRAVLVDRRVEDRERGAVPGEGLEEKRREVAGFGGAEIPLGRENVALEPGQERFLDAGDEGVLRNVRVDVDEPGNNDTLRPAEEFRFRSSGAFRNFRKRTPGGDPAVFDQQRPVMDAARGMARRGIDQEAA